MGIVLGSAVQIRELATRLVQGFVKGFDGRLEMVYGRNLMLESTFGSSWFGLQSLSCEKSLTLTSAAAKVTICLHFCKT